MSIRPIVLAAVVMSACAAGSAAAQTAMNSAPETAPAALEPQRYREPRLDVAFGYLFVRHVDGSFNLTKGGFFDVNSTGPVAIAGEISASFVGGSQEWRFLIGPRFGQRHRGETPALELLIGATRFSPGEATSFTVAPGLAVDMWGDRQAGARFKLNFLARQQGTRWLKGFSIGLGIVFGG